MGCLFLHSSLLFLVSCPSPRNGTSWFNGFQRKFASFGEGRRQDNQQDSKVISHFSLGVKHVTLWALCEHEYLYCKGIIVWCFSQVHQMLQLFCVAKNERTVRVCSELNVSYHKRNILLLSLQVTPIECFGFQGSQNSHISTRAREQLLGDGCISCLWIWH